jgi:hypothetical protein
MNTFANVLLGIGYVGCLVGFIALFFWPLVVALQGHPPTLKWIGKALLPGLIILGLAIGSMTAGLAIGGPPYEAAVRTDLKASYGQVIEPTDIDFMGSYVGFNIHNPNGAIQHDCNTKAVKTPAGRWDIDKAGLSADCAVALYRALS